MNNRIPLTKARQLDELDESEMLEGYWDGYAGESEPGDNRSFSFWHGWRNGAVDGKHRESDNAQILLAHDCVESRRK